MTRYISLAEFVWLAEQVTSLEASVIMNASRIDLADSALHAPAAGFGDEDFYPDPYEKAAVLACRLAWNHPLPDGNKRAAGLADEIDPRYRAFVLLAAYGGLRLGELGALRRARVDLLAGRVDIAETLVEVNNRTTISPSPPRCRRRA